MNPKGTVFNAQGSLNRLSVLVVSAYDIALKHGFEGTEEEWLESLNAAAVTDAQISKAITDYFTKNPITSGSTATIGTVELLASKWVQSEISERLHYQEHVTFTGIPETFDIESCQVDLTPSVEQLVVFYEKDLTFVTENEEGNVTVYAIGQKPEHDYTIQVTLTEVSV